MAQQFIHTLPRFSAAGGNLANIQSNNVFDFARHAPRFLVVEERDATVADFLAARGYGGPQILAEYPTGRDSLYHLAD